MKVHRFTAALVACGALAIGAIGCSDDDEPGSAGAGAQSSVSQDLSGSIRIDGSSTVEPVAEAAIERFNAEAPNVQISLGGSGTGAGFEKFCRGETEISDASRPIETEEFETCTADGIEPVEVEVAIDGLTIVTHPDLEVPNDCITTEQLKTLLEPGADMTNYSDLGEGFPDQEASFFTPGPESGTFDYFTEVVLESDAEQRTDGVQTSSNDNQIVTGISGTEGAIGYVGYSFAEENRDSLKILQVDGGEGCVEPTLETIANGEYAPLSRPLYMYPSVETAAQPEVKAFLEFVNQNGAMLAEDSGYIALPEDRLSAAAELIANPTVAEAPAAE